MMFSNKPEFDHIRYCTFAEARFKELSAHANNMVYELILSFDPLFSDNVQRSPGLNVHACLNVAPLTYRESVSKCSDLGLKLLNQSLSNTHYDNLIDDLGFAVHYSEAVMYWLLKNDRYVVQCLKLSSDSVF